MDIHMMRPLKWGVPKMVNPFFPILVFIDVHWFSIFPIIIETDQTAAHACSSLSLNTTECCRVRLFRTIAKSKKCFKYGVLWCVYIYTHMCSILFNPNLKRSAVTSKTVSRRPPSMTIGFQALTKLIHPWFHKTTRGLMCATVKFYVFDVNQNTKCCFVQSNVTL